MQTHIAYCSACDRDVRVVVTDEPTHEGHANLPDSEVVCLEMGHHCTGNLCPIGATSPTVMAARLVRSGVRTLMMPLVTLDCATCGMPTSYVVLEPSQASCTQCGTTVDRIA